MAQDGDNALKWDMTYSIVPDGESENFFACDSSTGEVTLKKILDRETKSQFVITIQVFTITKSRFNFNHFLFKTFIASIICSHSLAYAYKRKEYFILHSGN